MNGNGAEQSALRLAAVGPPAERRPPARSTPKPSPCLRVTFVSSALFLAYFAASHPPGPTRFASQPVGTLATKSADDPPNIATNRNMPMNDAPRPGLAYGGDLRSRIIGTAIPVHRQLGPGLLESVYAKCLCLEFNRDGIRYQREVRVPIIYDGKTLDSAYTAGLIVDDQASSKPGRSNASWRCTRHNCSSTPASPAAASASCRTSIRRC